MNDSFYGDLSIIGMRGCEAFTNEVDSYIKDWRRHVEDETYIAQADCPRFGSGEAKGLIHESMRGRDVYIICDVFNYGVTYKMYGMTVPMSPDDHYQDLKRIISAIGERPEEFRLLCRCCMKDGSTTALPESRWTARLRCRNWFPWALAIL